MKIPRGDKKQAGATSQRADKQAQTVDTILQPTSIKVQRAVSDLRHSRPALIRDVCQHAKRRARAGHRAQPPSPPHLARLAWLARLLQASGGSASPRLRRTCPSSLGIAGSAQGRRAQRVCGPCLSLALARKPPRARARARGVCPRAAAVVALATARVRACPLGCWLSYRRPAQAFGAYAVVGLAAWVRAGRVGISDRKPETGGPESVFKVQRGALQGAQAQGVCHGADVGVGWIRVCLLPFVGWMRGCLLPVAVCCRCVLPGALG